MDPDAGPAEPDLDAGPAEPGAGGGGGGGGGGGPPASAKVRRALLNAIFSEALLLNKNHAHAAQVLRSLVAAGVPGADLRRQLLVDFRDKKGGNLVHDFAAVGNVDCCRVLVRDVGVDVNLRRRSDKCTPLHVAVWNDHAHVKDGLLELGGDPLVQNAFGETADDTAVVAVAKPDKGLGEDVVVPGGGGSGARKKQGGRPRNGSGAGPGKGKGSGSGGGGGGGGGGAGEVGAPRRSVGAQAARVCAKLSEPNRPLVQQAVRVMGVGFCEELLQETLATEREGGLMVEPKPGRAAAAAAERGGGAKKRRRRSPGGVFLFLLRQRCSPEQWQAVTQRDRATKRMQRTKMRGRRKKQQSGGTGGQQQQQQPGAAAAAGGAGGDSGAGAGAGGGTL